MKEIKSDFHFFHFANSHLTASHLGEVNLVIVVFRQRGVAQPLKSLKECSFSVAVSAYDKCESIVTKVKLIVAVVASEVFDVQCLEYHTLRFK